MYSKYVYLTSIRDDFLTNRSGKIMTDRLLLFILLLREGKRSLISVSYMLLLLLLWRAWGAFYQAWTFFSENIYIYIYILFGYYPFTTRATTIGVTVVACVVIYEFINVECSRETYDSDV
jgi:hypothetical protein